MAQLVAHLLCKQGVTGSSPVGSTTYFPHILRSPRRPIGNGWSRGTCLSPSFRRRIGTRKSTTRNGVGYREGLLQCWHMSQVVVPV